MNVSILKRGKEEIYDNGGIEIMFELLNETPVLRYTGASLKHLNMGHLLMAASRLV